MLSQQFSIFNQIEEINANEGFDLTKIHISIESCPLSGFVVGFCHIFILCVLWHYLSSFHVALIVTIYYDFAMLTKFSFHSHLNDRFVLKQHFSAFKSTNLLVNLFFHLAAFFFQLNTLIIIKLNTLLNGGYS